jgi:6-phosphogluconate dehydrogenase
VSNSTIGIVGAGVMGRNLALNFASNGYPAAIYDRDTALLDAFASGEAGPALVTCARDIEAFVNALARPRRILMMVTAGPAVDWCIEALLPHLDPGDVLIDGGNSLFTDTERRCAALEAQGLLYLGMGVSGGEFGARTGPALMPGGSAAAWPLVRDMLEAVAAKHDGIPCCAYLGAGGAGHFVKMIHNGIEYADMQLIAEAYWLLRKVAGLKPDQQAPVFGMWNEGPLESYLIEITSRILASHDPLTGSPMVDIILDTAGQKGTGKWTSQAALDFGTPAPTIAEAVFARCLSALKDERMRAGEEHGERPITAFMDKDTFIDHAHDALYASKICAYAQGFAILRDANREHNWNLDFASIASIWRAGCIIRAGFLDHIRAAFDENVEIPNLLMNRFFWDALRESEEGWRATIMEAVRTGVPAPAFASALAYYDAYHAPVLPASLLQAQRDLFGAHRYERVDRPRGETFHSDWDVETHHA